MGERIGGFETVEDLDRLPDGMHADRKCRGLYVQVRRENGNNSRSWIFRWKRRGAGDKSSRVMGLGACDCTAANLDGARKRAAEAREHVLAGKDPIEERNRQRNTLAVGPMIKRYLIVRDGEDGISKQHKKQMRNGLLAMRPLFERLVIDLTEDDLSEALGQYAPGYADKIVNYYRTCVNWAASQGLVELQYVALARVWGERRSWCPFTKDVRRRTGSSRQ